MTDSTLNRFVSSGTTAERTAFTPSPPTPASGPDPGYLWWDTDLQEEFAYDFGLADWVSTAGTGTTEASTTEILTGTDTTKFGSPNSIAALWEKGADEASGATVSLGEGGYFHITGTTTITDIDFDTDKSGRKAILVFDDVLTLTHNATSLILPTGANITTAAGDTCCVVSEDGSNNVRVVWYQRKDGTALVGGSGSGALVFIATQTASGTPATLTFSSIANTWKHLVLKGYARGTQSANNVDLRLRMNGDSGNNYNYEFLVGFGTATSVSQGNAVSFIKIADLPAANSTANYVGSPELEIRGYKQTTFFKPLTGTNMYNHSTSSGDINVVVYSGQWLSTAAITALELSLSAGNFVDGSSFDLYGVSV